MPRLEKVDRRAVARAAKGLAPMLRRRSALFGIGFARGGEASVRASIHAMLEAVEDDDLFAAEEESLLWCRVERSGLVLVGVGKRAYIVARVQARGGRAARLLVR
ncbi:MAG TPA: hypothetical protein VFH78_00970 [Candidatus Thermoplasmatota archaeon]|nr:hypothetical protein [Candidatus Thermoplasmatota archaeon]